MAALKFNYRLNLNSIQLLVTYGYRELKNGKIYYKPLILNTKEFDYDKTFDIKSGRFKKINPDHKNLNLKIEKIEHMIITLFNKLDHDNKDIKTIRPEILKNMLQPEDKKILNTNISIQNSNLIDVIQQYIDVLNKMGTLTEATIKQYKHFLVTLKKYLKSKPLYESDLNLQFHAGFFEYLKKCDYAINTIWKYQKILRSVYKHLISQGIKINYDYLSAQIRVSYKIPDTLALSIDELKIIFNHKTEKAYLNRVKDLFLFQCCTLVRYSDINKMVKMNKCKTSEGIEYPCFYITTEKTDIDVTIPVISLAKTIYEKYNGLLPEISNQKYNKYLREVLNEIDYFKEVRTKTVFENKKKVIIKYKLAEEITTHTARRSGATMLFNLGVPVRSIMNITGHKQLETFFQYIRINTDDNNSLLSVINKFDNLWSN